MRLALTFVALLFAGAVVRAEDDYIPNSGLDAAGFVKLWQLRLPLEPGQQVADAYSVDEALYVATKDGYVYALDIDTGALRWMHQVTTGGYRVLRPCHVGDRVIFVTASQSTQYDRLTGEPIRRTNLRYPAGSGLVGDNGQYFFGSLNRRFYCLGVNDDFETWKSGTNGSIVSTPALHGEVLYVASDDGGVYSCFTADKRFHWQSATTGANTADLVADERGVYVASRDRSLYLFDQQFGKVVWRARLSGPLTEAPSVTTEVAYQFESLDGLVAINTAVLDVQERVRWKLPRGRALLTVHENNAYVLSRQESILVVDNVDGNLISEIPAAGFGIPAPRPADALIMLGSADGRLFAAKPKGAPRVRREDVRKAIYGEAKTADATPTTQPARQPVIPPAAETGRAQAGPPAGGKSKVSRDFGRGGASGAGAASGGGASSEKPGEKPAEKPATPEKKPGGGH
ncbi:MAG: PQQ-binding-like beta-propeller repeat protein [Phycisphaerae bacterium]